jgi:lysophospholipase L1-like esterase
VVPRLRRGLRLALVLAATGWCLPPAVNAAPPEPASIETRASGPLPYPADAAHWPGRGVTRVFGWMMENRRSFWLQRTQKQGSVVFAGDSLIAGWRSLQSDFPSLPTANRGIGGDVSRGLLFRFQGDVLDLHPRAIVLLVGTNDLSARQAPADTLFNIAAMLDMARQHSAGVPIVLCTLPPRAHRDAPVEPARLAELNAGIQALAAGRDGVSVVDLFEPFTADDGSIDERLFAADRLHLSVDGYARWRGVLAPVLAARLADAARQRPVHTPARTATGWTP